MSLGNRVWKRICKEETAADQAGRMREALSAGVGADNRHILGNEKRSRASAWDEREKEPEEVTGMRPSQCHRAQTQRAEQTEGRKGSCGRVRKPGE